MANKKSKVTPKISLKIVLAIFATVAIIMAISTQIWINYYQNQRINGLYTWQFKTMLTDAMDGLYKFHTTIEENGQIPEARLQIDKSSLDENEELVYMYYEEEGTIQVTSSTNLTYAKYGSLNITNMDTLMSSVPSAQACVRGYTLSIDKTVEENDGLKLVESRTLTDGRTINIYRETSCQAPNMDTLESALNTVETY